MRGLGCRWFRVQGLGSREWSVGVRLSGYRSLSRKANSGRDQDFGIRAKIEGVEAEKSLSPAFGVEVSEFWVENLESRM